MAEIDADETLTPPRAQAGEDRGRSSTAGWAQAIALAVLVRVAFFSVAYAAEWFLTTETQGHLQHGFWEIWNRWDARHFLDIAEHGYFATETTSNPTAFFPGYPLAIRALGVLGIPSLAAGLVISFAGSVVAFRFLIKWVDEEVGRGAGWGAALFLALFPTAVFLVAPYSESLFLAGAIPSFYFARRGEWVKSGVGAAVAMGTRSAGMFLLAGLLVEFLRQRKFSRPDLFDGAVGMVIGALPLLAYGAFLNLNVGDPLHFLTAQEEGWGRRLTSPLNALRSTWGTWENAEHATNWLFAWRVEVFAAAVGILFVAWALKRRDWGGGVYMGLTLGALVGSAWYLSIPRILLSFFPVYVYLAGFLYSRRVPHDVVVVVMAPIAAMGVIVYTRFAWFF